MKTCISCGKPKSLDEFGFNHREPDGRKKECSQCWDKHARGEAEWIRSRVNATTLKELAKEMPLLKNDD